MMHDQNEDFDQTLADYLVGKERDSGEIAPFRSTFEQLEVLREVPERNLEAQTLGRETFLQQARSLNLPVSKSTGQRLKGWKSIFRKERISMSTLVSVILALVFALGGVGTTAYASQESLPTEPLYPVKQFTEQIRLVLTTERESKVNLLLDLSEERVNEITALANEGETIPVQTQEQLQEQLQLALTEMAQLGEAQMLGALEQLRTMAQLQIKNLQQTKQNAPEESAQGLELTIQAMNRVQNEAEEGLADPATFRLRQGTNRPDDAPLQPEKLPQDGGKDEPSSSEEIPGQGYGDGSGEGGGAYGDGYGDGTGEGGEAYGKGHGDGSGDGGEAYGEGKSDDSSCDTEGCTPQPSGRGSHGLDSGGARD